MNRYRVLINFLFLTVLMSCCTINLQTLGLIPKYEGVDPQAASYVAEWQQLAKYYKIEFTKKVTIGFDKINSESVVGYCEYGTNFREITLDSSYWANSTKISKMVIVFHELSHCSCNRSHSYIIDNHTKEYGNDESSRKNPSKKDGFFKDTCPISIMYPYVIEDYCFTTHYSDYVDEMFKDCEPY